MKTAIIVFPGTNCDRDTYEACSFFGWNPHYIYHNETNINTYDIIFLPGGFSYGDYIHSGRLAKFSPVINSIKEYIKEKRGFIIGICNGFQILCESKILKGALTINENIKFICDETKINFMSEELLLPIAHKEGRYIFQTKEKDVIYIKYKDNPNGSMDDIAGIYDKDNKILAMMPHPERAVFKETGNTQGRRVFEFIQKELN